jgi:thioredoxin reductase
VDEFRTETCDVAIVGGGPAGLAAARVLKDRGIARVVVIERESDAGGIPRHCNHSPFGMREFGRIMNGPRYARRLVQAANDAGVDVRTRANVVRIESGGSCVVTSPEDIYRLSARRVLLATGVRETTRASRLVSGERLVGVCNTGTLQSMVFLKDLRPFRRPLIVGTELVSFSAILTCLGARIRPVAMIEENARATARWPSILFPKVAGIPVHFNTRLSRIEGKHHVSAATVKDQHGSAKTIDCDGVLFTGRFLPEASLARCGHLKVDDRTGGPIVDQYGRCSDPAFFATGNLLRAVETAGWCWREGQKIGGWLADDLTGRIGDGRDSVDVTTATPAIKLAMPQRIGLPFNGCGMRHMQLRFARAARGRLVARNCGNVVWSTRIHARPERRVLVPLEALLGSAKPGPVEFSFEEMGKKP